MGFIYTKPLSIEGVFSKFDTDGNGKISKEEAQSAKKMDVFTNFKVNKGMTLKKFERKNKDIYAKYEQYATEAYNKQEEKVQQWLKMEQMALEETNELNSMKDTQKEPVVFDDASLELTRDEMITHAWLKYGISLSKEEEKNLPIDKLKQRLEMQILIKKDIQKYAPKWGY